MTCGLLMARLSTCKDGLWCKGSHFESQSDQHPPIYNWFHNYIPIWNPQVKSGGSRYGFKFKYTVGTDVTTKLPQIHIADTIWLSLEDKEWQRHCSGSNVHSVCIVSSGDLHRLKYNTDPDDVIPPLFHNKYSMAEDHTVMDCMEELLVERNKQDYMRDAHHIAS